MTLFTTEAYVAQLVALRSVTEAMVDIARDPARRPPIDEVPSTVVELLDEVVAKINDAIDAIDDDPDIGTPEDLGTQNLVDLPRSQRGLQ